MFRWFESNRDNLLYKKGDETMKTNANLLRSKLAANGYMNFTAAIAEILNISYGAASAKLNNKNEFTQSEIAILAKKLDLSDKDIRKIFVDGVE